MASSTKSHSQLKRSVNRDLMKSTDLEGDNQDGHLYSTPRCSRRAKRTDSEIKKSKKKKAHHQYRSMMQSAHHLATP